MRALAFTALLSVLPVTACGNHEKPPARVPARFVSEWPYSGRAQTVRASHAVVASGSPIASAIGRDVLREGGNAVDAAVAVGFALAVVHPEAGNLGGGGFMLVRNRDGVHALDYRETAPSGATPTMYLDASGHPTDRSVTGGLASGVPGSVAGLVEAHRKYGKLPLAAVIEPAIRLADEGFVVDEARSRSIAADSSRLSRFPASRAAFLPNGRPPAPGSVFRQPDLATTLRAVRDRGAAGFYQGRVADLIVAEMKRTGGIITHGDLAAYRAIWRDPIAVTYRGYTVYSMPPASSGGVTLGEILNIMEGYSTLPSFGSTRLTHLEAEAMRRAFADRNRYLGDPAFVVNPLDRLLSKKYADSLRRQIDIRSSPMPGMRPTSGKTSTTHYSVVDAEGNAVSCTTTLNDYYGSGVTVTGAGFALNDQMDDFAGMAGPSVTSIQGEANALLPGKRMLSSMTPAIVLDSAKAVYLVTGTRGGSRMITMAYHVISNIIDHRMSLADAVSAPRLHDQGLPDSLWVEANGFSTAVLDSLKTQGHHVANDIYGGDVQAILRSGEGWEGVSDPRAAGGASGY